MLACACWLFPYQGSLYIFDLLPIEGYKICQVCIALVSTIPIVFLIFPCFIPIFYLAYNSFPYLNMCTEPKTSIPRLLRMESTMPIFLSVFLGSYVQVSIFWNAPCTLTTIPHHHHQYWEPYLFFRFLAYFIAIFHLRMQFFPYLAMYSSHWISYPFWLPIRNHTTFH